LSINSTPFEGDTTNAPDVGGSFVTTVIEVTEFKIVRVNVNIAPAGKELAASTRLTATGCDID